MSERTHSYEIYVHQKGRWELHARHALNKRDAALEEAKSLKNIPSIQEVKVVHDVFDTNRGKSNESVIYRSNESSSAASSPANDDRNIRRHDDDDGEYDDIDDEPQPVSLGAAASPRRKPIQRTTRKVKTGVFTKLLLLALASFIIAGMITWVIALAIEELPELKGWIGRSNYDDILFLIFIIGFLLSISTSAFAFLTKEELAGEVHVKEMEDSEQRKWARAMAPPKLTPKQRRALERANARRLEEANAEFFDGDENEGGADNLDDVLAASEGGEAPPEDVKLTIGAEKQKVNVMTFLSKGLESVMATRPKLDSFNKFGVNLYLAGACETVGIEENLNDDEIRQILIDSVGVLGTKPEQAIMFAEKYDEYLMNPKYLGMIENGRSAMNAQVNGDPDAAQKLDKAMD